MTELKFPRLGIEEIDAEMQKKKLRIVVDKVKELTGIEIDLEKEKYRTFPRLTIKQISQDEETYFFNDGTEKGLRVVTFKRVITQKLLDNEVKITLDYIIKK